MHATEPGTYILIIEVPHRVSVSVGSLGLLTFDSGYYLYVGSALGGLRARLARHLRPTKRLHWHIDYLLPHGRICQVWYRVDGRRLECAWARLLGHLPGVAAYPAPFGASDCACRTHLFYTATRPDPAAFSQAVQIWSPRPDSVDIPRAPC